MFTWVTLKAIDANFINLGFEHEGRKYMYLWGVCRKTISKMRTLIFVFVITIVIILTLASSYRISRRINYTCLSRNIFILHSSREFPNSGGLDRELDTFFEKAAESGSTFAKKLTPAERAERVAKGVELEDEIFNIRDKIVDLGQLALRFIPNPQKITL